MIQNIRDKLSGITAFVIVLLIGIPFAFYGVESLFLNANRVTEVASVDGSAVTTLDLERELQLREGYLLQQMGENFDPEMIDRANLSPAVLRYLVDLELFEVTGREGGLGVSDAELAANIQQIPEFRLGGVFSQSQFRLVLSRLGYTTSTFLEALEGNLVVQQLQDGIVRSAFLSPAELAQQVAVLDETRSFQSLRVPAEALEGEIAVSDAEVVEFFESNRDSFVIPEQISVDYLLLDAAELEASVEPTEQQILERYRALTAEQSTRRQVAHILIEPRDDGSEMEIVAQIENRLAAGEDFADLAQEFSEDLGSATSGGDLGFTDGTGLPASFVTAMEQLAVGEVSAPVTTESGVHLVKLLALEEGSARPLDEMRDEVVADLRTALAQERFAELGDRLGRLAFATDDLEQLLLEIGTEESGLQINRSPLFSRDTGSGIADNARFRDFAFSPQVLLEDRNSDRVELSATQAVVLHLHDRQPSRAAALEEVAGDIRALLEQQKLFAAASALGSSLQAEIGNGASLESLAEERGYSWQVHIDVPRGTEGELGLAAFGLATTGDTRSFPTQDGGVALVRLDAVQPGSLAGYTAPELQSLARQLALTEAQPLLSAYLEYQRTHRDVEIAPAFAIAE